jgi:Helix-turn-helix domain
MPWKESRILDQRLQFLSSYQKEEMSVADLCREYGISRPTGYRWINRYNETGPEGLVDRSRRPHSCSHATLEPIENTILVLRAKHPSWGARKLYVRVSFSFSMKGGFAIGRYFGRTAIRSISTKAPRVPVGRTTCTVVRAGLFGWSLVPKNWLYPAIIPAKSILPSFVGSPPRYTCIITTSLSVSFCDSRNFWMSHLIPLRARDPGRQEFSVQS